MYPYVKKNPSLSSEDEPARKPTKVWPTKVLLEFAKKCAAQYHKALQMEHPLCCAVCARSKRELQFTVYELTHKNIELPISFELLRLPTTHKRYHSPDFCFLHPTLNHLTISRRGLANSDCNHDVKLNICHECLNPLKKTTPSLPRHALMNGLYVGVLPDHPKDTPRPEEQICAIARTGPIEYRLYGSDSKEQPLLAKGNVSCASSANRINGQSSTFSS